MTETLHAIVRDGQFVESRMVDAASVPQHKLDSDGGKICRPFVDPAQPEHSALERATSQLVVTPEQVERVWTVERKSLAVQQQCVKDECGRRIYTPFPQWRQANYTARATELVLAKTNGGLTQEESDELTALQAVWTWIKSVRAASDLLEAANPIPADYTDDKHWPSMWEG
jgi:hypothetical protein